jgi:hypothetical protein
MATHPETPVFFGSLDATKTFFEGVLTAQASRSIRLPRAARMVSVR